MQINRVTASVIIPSGFQFSDKGLAADARINSLTVSADLHPGEDVLAVVHTLREEIARAVESLLLASVDPEGDPAKIPGGTE